MSDLLSLEDKVRALMDALKYSLQHGVLLLNRSKPEEVAGLATAYNAVLKHLLEDERARRGFPPETAK